MKNGLYLAPAVFLLGLGTTMTTKIYADEGMWLFTIPPK